MGLFGGIKKRWNDGSLMNGLQAAGAIVHGDYGPAAQIEARRRPNRPTKADSSAATARVATPRDAARAWQSLGPDGQAAFERWLNDYRAEAGARPSRAGTTEP